MIAFLDNLPLVQLESGQAVAFDRNWLLRSLTSAARKAGFAQWWLADHVAESVTHFLRSQSELRILTIEKLQTAVRSVLQVIGYGEISGHFVVGLPVVQVSLVDLARAAGTGYELAFFELLGRQIQDLLHDDRRHFELLGLEPCVKMLRSKKAWSRDCDALRAEIVSFAREQTGIAAAKHDVSFSLA